MVGSVLMHVVVGLALVAVTGLAEPVDRTVITVRVDDQSGRTDGVDQNTVISALTLRLRRTPISVQPWEQEQPVDAWTVVIVCKRHRITIRVSSPDGRELVARSLATANRQAADLAHTIALMAVEALTPALPELMEVLPAEEEPPPTEDVLVQESAESNEILWSIRVGGSVQLLWPRQTATWGGQLMGSASWGLLVAEADAGWWGGLAHDGADDLSVSASHGLLRLSAGVQWDMGGARLSATAGPALRLVRVAAEGPDVLFDTRLFVDPGIGSRVSFLVDAVWVHVGLALELSRFFAHPRLVVDGERVLNAGHTATGCIIWLARDL